MNSNLSMISMITTDKKWKRVIYPLLFIILSAIIVFNITRITQQSNKVIPFRVEGGWGYKIVSGERTVIEQPFIPLLSGKNAFPTRNLAKKTGKLVLERIENGTVPVLTFDDLKDLGLIN